MTRPWAVVLLVHAGGPLAAALAESAQREGLALRAAPASDALGAISLLSPGVIVIESVASMPALELCRSIRAQTEIPIVLVGVTPDGLDPVAALEAGADDVVSRPARQRELLARIRAVLRRSFAPVETETPSDDQDRLLQVGEVRLDNLRHEVEVSGMPVALPLKEFELLELLLANAGRVLTRKTLITRVWGASRGGDSKTLDAHVKRLRAKIEVDPSRPTRITTVRGVGYRYETAPNGRSPHR